MRAASLLAASVALALAGCKGSPSEPSAAGALLHTQHGTLTVATEGRAFDADAAVAAIDDGYRQAIAQDARAALVSLDGMVIVVEPVDYAVNGVPANGAYYPPNGPFHVREGVERVLRYETLHPICHGLGMPAWCANIKRADA